VTVKEQVMAKLEELPETATLEEIREEFEILAAIEEGQRDASAGRVFAASELRAELRSWTERRGSLAVPGAI